MSRRLFPLLLLAAGLSVGCSRQPATVQRSPDGSMTLTTAINYSKADPTRYLCMIVEIQDSAGKTLHREVTPASSTHRWSARWVGDDEVLLRSSDVGDYRIRREPEGAWRGELRSS